jgi:hypothetical protein
MVKICILDKAIFDQLFGVIIVVYLRFFIL